MSQSKEYAKEYRRKNRELINQKARDKCKKVRKEVIEALGGKCLFCGFLDIRALQVDHKYGGGCKEKRKLATNGTVFNEMVLDTIRRGDDKYQLLCANCNWIKRVTNKEIPWT